jgi:GNAT superfamily N-acetyltransferase
VASYRFCRPDDLPLLVRALADCWRVHYPAAPEPTVERFRREMKELDVWPSSCMVALGGAGGREPIAVLIGTRRPAEVLVLRVGVRPDYLRQGHASHLLTSLSQKLAVLGPERLVAEVPRGMAPAEALLAAVGYEPEAVYTDWTLDGEALAAAAAAPVPEEAIAPVTVADLAAAGALEIPPGVAWERQRPTLLQRADRLAALAVAGAERVEAWVLYEPAAEADALDPVDAGEAAPATAEAGSAAAGGAAPIDVWAAGCADPGRCEPLLALLLRALAARAGLPLRLPRLGLGELPEDLPAALGFTPGAEYTRWAARARPL